MLADERRRRFVELFTDRPIRKTPTQAQLDDLFVLFDGFAEPGRLRAGWQQRTGSPREKQMSVPREKMRHMASGASTLDASRADAAQENQADSPAAGNETEVPIAEGEQAATQPEHDKALAKD